MSDTTRKTVGLGRKQGGFSGDTIGKSIVETLLYQIKYYKLRMKLNGKTCLVEITIKREVTITMSFITTRAQAQTYRTRTNVVPISLMCRAGLTRLTRYIKIF